MRVGLVFHGSHIDRYQLLCGMNAHHVAIYCAFGHTYHPQPSFEKKMRMETGDEYKTVGINAVSCIW